MVCATREVSDRPAYTRSPIGAFAGHLGALGLLGCWPSGVCSCVDLKGGGGAAHARLGLRMSNCHIVGNHMARVKCNVS